MRKQLSEDHGLAGFTTGGNILPPREERIWAVMELRTAVPVTICLGAYDTGFTGIRLINIGDIFTIDELHPWHGEVTGQCTGTSNVSYTEVFRRP